MNLSGPDDSDSPFRPGIVGDHDRAWLELLEGANCESLLVVIAMRMGPDLRQRLEPMDVLQESLALAWRDRGGARFAGVREFRAWLLAIIENRIRDLADEAGARKRGGGVRRTLLADDLARTGSSTPSRPAIRQEIAEAMRAALAQVPDECREVVFLRLFRQMTLREVAEQLGLGLGSVRGLLRRGSEIYRQRLHAAVVSQTTMRVVPHDGGEG